MKKKNLKSLKLNKQAISGFHQTEVNGGKNLIPTKQHSCYPDMCFTVISINDYTCDDPSHNYGSCNAACDTFNYTDLVC